MFSYPVRSFRRPMISVCVIALGISLNASAKAPATPRDGSTVEQRIRRIQNGLLPPVLVQGQSAQTTKLADRMSELRVPGVSIAVIRNGKIEWARGFGVTKIGGPPVTPDTLFQAASISKPVAAMAALRLVESGKLNLDADVNQYLKSWKIPANSFTDQSKVTLFKLLSHTAGLTVHGFGGYESNGPIPTAVQVLNGEKPANSPPIVVDILPGKMMRYSGGGYVVMQQMLEDVTGQPFPKLMRDTVLGPAGMRHSTYDQPLPKDRMAEAAMPYLPNGQPVKGGPHIYPEMAAAGLWTTPSDLARFAIALQGSLSGKPKRVLSAVMARKMVTAVLDNYGLGLATGGSSQHPYFTHGGANAGFRCNLVAYHNGDGAAIMTNSDSGDQLATEILRTIAHEYGWPDYRPVERKAITLAPKALEQYVGTYKLSPGANLMIMLEGGQLMGQVSRQAKLPLFASSESKFFQTAVDAEIEFIKDEQNTVTSLILRQYGRDTKGLRISDQAVEWKEIKVSPSMLAQYVGTYEIGPGFNLIITLEGDQLFAELTGQGKAALFAEGETKFFPKVIDVQIEFVRDDKGVVTHLMLRRGTGEIKAMRK